MTNSETLALVEKIKQRKLSVLFVEDNKELRRIIGDSLKIAFHKSKVVGDGREALEELDRDSYDLIITDLNMPYVNGAELIHRIREKCKIFPIIITTAHFEFDEVYNAIPNLFVITKPYSIFEILKAVDSLETNAKILIEDDVYEKLDASYDEARKILEIIQNKCKGI